MSIKEPTLKIGGKSITFSRNPKLNQKKETTHTGVILDAKLIFFSVFCVLSALANFGSNITPFMYPLWVYLYNREERYKGLPLLSVGTLLLHAGIIVAVKGLICLGIIYIATYLLRKNSGFLTPALISGITAAVMGVFFTYFANSDMFNAIESLLEGLLAFTLFYVFSTGFSCIFNYKEKTNYTTEELICICVIFAAILSGLNTFTLYGISLSCALSVFSVLFAGYYFGLTQALTLALLCGLLINLGDVRSANLIGVLTFCSFASAATAKYDKYIAVLTFIFANFFVNYLLVGFDTPVLNLKEVLLGSVVFILFDLLLGKDFVKEKNEADNMQISINEAVDKLIKDEIDIQKSMLSHINRNLNLYTYESNGSVPNNVCKTLMTDVCSGCNMFGRCWQQYPESSYEQFKQVIQLYEKNPAVSYQQLPNSFLGHCSKSYMMFKMVAYLCDSMKMKNNYDLKLNRFKEMMNGQFKHLTSVLDRLYSQLSRGIVVNSKEAENVSAALESNGFGVDKLLVLQDFAGQEKIYFRSKERLEESLYTRAIPQLLSEVLEKNIVFDYSANTATGAGNMEYTYIRQAPYKLTVGIAKCSKDKSLNSGDNYSHIYLNNANQLLAIADGMGSGDKAAAQSERVLNLLEELLNAGYSESGAIKTINSILALEENKEIFTTLDAFIFDCNKGIGEFIKAGATTTYVKKGYHVEKVEASSLPIGILEEIQIDKIINKFEKGQFIFLLSDGFFDAIKNDEDWLIEQIGAMDYRNPQKMADELYERALHISDGKAGDDITIMVAKVRA